MQAVENGLERLVACVEEYDKAMEYFKIAGAKDAYSKVYVKAKKIRMNQVFPYYLGGGVILFIGLLIGLRIRRKRREKRRARL